MEINKNYDFFLDVNEKNPLIIAMALVVINLISLLILIIAASFLNVSNPFLMLTVPTVISFIILPKLLLKCLNIEDNLDVFRYLKTSSVIFISFVAVYLLIFRSKLDMTFVGFWIVHYLIVATGEEYIYRHLLISLLYKKMSIIISCAISSIVFAFILHNNEDFLTNLVIRLPLALMLSGIYVKTKSLSLPIVIHAIYNLLVMIV
ncbi:CPBP family intramembrane glutamic endopeptidase [Finegoldia magna]|uniref:CPBP family intramembrane glutamic endopeptidase n=1 Tax=Finegoldia magna TaxID=1260 RepID=UPI00399B78DE